MIVREIYLYPDLTKYPGEFTSLFRDQTRSVCNFLERRIRALKFEAQGFKKIGVIGSPNPTPACVVNTSGGLAIEIELDQQAYAATPKSDLNEFFISMLIAGFTKCRGQHKIPEEDLLQGIEAFRNADYVNEWIFKQKTFKELHVKVRLKCRLTIEQFTLTLQVETSNGSIQEIDVLNTPPDEIVFEPKFKDVMQDKTSIVIVDKFGDPIHRLDLALANLKKAPGR